MRNRRSIDQIRRLSDKKYNLLKDCFGQLGVVESWIEFTRNALGMTVSQLAKKVGVSQSVITNAKNREIKGSITLGKLSEIADAMDCDLVYGLVPRGSIEQIVEKQSILKAKEIMMETNLHMELENQDPDDKEFHRRQEDIANEMKYSKALWNKE
jgi:predicted DNA-binding mobile mystery protein A